MILANDQLDKTVTERQIGHLNADLQDAYRSMWRVMTQLEDDMIAGDESWMDFVEWGRREVDEENVNETILLSLSKVN